MKGEKAVWLLCFCSAMRALEEQKHKVTEIRKTEKSNNYEFIKNNFWR